MSTLDVSLPENRSPISPTLQDSPTIPEPMFSIASQACRQRSFSFHENDDKAFTQQLREHINQTHSPNTKPAHDIVWRSTYPQPQPPYELPTTPNQLHELPADIPAYSPTATSDSEADSTRDLESGGLSRSSMLDEKCWGKQSRSTWGRWRDWFARQSEVQKALIRLVAVVTVSVIAVAIGLSLTSASKESSS